MYIYVQCTYMYVCVYMEYEGQYCEAGGEKEWELVSPVVHSNWQDKGCYYCEIVGLILYWHLSYPK